MLPSQPTLLNLLQGLILACLLMGCDKFEGDQEVPAYLDIEVIGFETDNATQGSSSQQITDAWIYVDEQLIGAFEMPATLPVLAQGSHDVEIRPGIKLNGISDTRAPYPCAQPIILEDISLEPDSITRLDNVVTGYYSNVEFHWIEDFEDQSLSLRKNNSSDTSIYRTSPADAPGAFLDEYSSFSGITWLEGDDNYLLLQSDDGNGNGFVLDRGDFVFLEINCKTEVPLVVGLLITYLSGDLENRPFIYLNTSVEWNKVYVNLTPVVNESIGAESFMIYFEGTQADGEDRKTIMLDNIKLLSRPNL